MSRLRVPLPPTNLSEGLLASPSASRVTDTGMPYATQWTTPRPPRPSGSTKVSAKLFVPAGGFFHSSGGETFSPTQLGLDLSLPAFFTASLPLSSRLGEVSVKSSATAGTATLRQSRAMTTFRKWPMIVFIRYSARKPGLQAGEEVPLLVSLIP